MRTDVREDLKLTKARAHYVYKPQGEPCKDCSMFRSPDGCTLVRGEIDPNGHCSYFERASGK